MSRFLFRINQTSFIDPFYFSLWEKNKEDVSSYERRLDHLIYKMLRTLLLCLRRIASAIY